MNNELIDFEALNELKDLMEEAFTELIQTYVEDCQLHMQSIEDELLSNNAPLIREHAHSIKGSSANLFVIGMIDICQNLENEAREGNLENAKQRLQAIKDKFHLVEKSFHEKGFI